MAAVAAINFRGVGESVKANVVLTLVELTGLLIIIFIGLWAIGRGQGDVSRVVDFKTVGDSMFWPVIAATTLAFFAMVGFEDSVNMAEECKDPTRHFPKVLLAGLVITGAIYVLVSISAITLVAPEQLGEGETPLLQVVQAGAPNFPLEIFGIITMFAVANSALINMLMASRLVYGMSREHVLPTVLGKVHPSRRTPYIAIGFTTLLAFGLITFVGEVPALGGTTALAAAVRLHRRQRHRAGAAPRPRRPPALPHADVPADPRRVVLRVPGRSVDRARSGPIQHRRHSASPSASCCGS